MTEEKPTPDPNEADVQDLPPDDEEAAEVTGGKGPSNQNTAGWDQTVNRPV